MTLHFMVIAVKIEELMDLAEHCKIEVPEPDTFEGFRARSALANFAVYIAAAEREECAKTVERARLDMDGSLGLTAETDFVATRITDFLAARIRALRQI